MLESEVCDGELQEAVFIGSEALPLHEDIERGHSKGQSHRKIVPSPMHNFLEMPDQSHHR